MPRVPKPLGFPLCKLYAGCKYKPQKMLDSRWKSGCRADSKPRARRLLAEGPDWRQLSLYQPSCNGAVLPTRSHITVVTQQTATGSVLPTQGWHHWLCCEFLWGLWDLWSLQEFLKISFSNSSHFCVSQSYCWTVQKLKHQLLKLYLWSFLAQYAWLNKKTVVYYSKIK